MISKRTKKRGGFSSFFVVETIVVGGVDKMYSGLDSFSAGSFWGQRNSLFSDVSPIDEILKKEDVALENILEDDNAIQEAKSMNEKLIEFVIEEENLRKLISYSLSTEEEAISMVQEWAEKHKSSTGEQSNSDEDLEECASNFRSVACEILCCNVPAVLDAIVKDVDMLSRLFRSLDFEPPMDARLSGYLNKITSVLLRHSPSTMLWFSIYGNLDISQDGLMESQNSQLQVGWVIGLLLKHIDSYSIACTFKEYLRVAADDSSLEEGSINGDSSINETHRSLGAGLSEHDRAFLRDVQSIWLGGSGTSEAVLKTLASRRNSDSHTNAAELLADMLQRATMARLSLQEIGSNELPTFSGFILESSGCGSLAAGAMIESGVEWTGDLAEKLISVALFEQLVDGKPASHKTTSNDFSKLVEIGSAPVASLQVLIHLVSAFGVERWSKPNPDVIPAKTISHIISAQVHGALPMELQPLVRKLPELVAGLTTEQQMKNFGVDSAHAESNFGMYRLKIAELICMMIHSRYPEVLNAIILCEPSPLNVLLDCFIKFEWNNSLHSLVERTIQFILLGGVSEESMGFDSESVAGSDDDNSFFERYSGTASPRRSLLKQEEIAREQKAATEALGPLQDCLFRRCNLIDRLICVYKLNGEAVTETHQYWQALDARDISQLKPTQRRFGGMGYMGFCHRIVNTIALVASSLRTFQSEQSEMLTALTATNGNEKWAQLLQVEIAQVNSFEQEVLGGERPDKSMFSVENDETDDFYEYGDDYMLDDDDDFGEIAAASDSKAFDMNPTAEVDVEDVTWTPDIGDLAIEGDEAIGKVSTEDVENVTWTPDFGDSAVEGDEAIDKVSSEEKPWEASFD